MSCDCQCSVAFPHGAVGVGWSYTQLSFNSELIPTLKFILMVKEEMPFKDISYLELWQPFCSAKRNHLCNFCKRCYEEQFCEIILNLDQWLRSKCRFKYFKSRALAALLTHLCKFARGCHEKQFCEIILNLGQGFRRWRLNDFLSGALATFLFGGAEPFVQF